MLRLLPELQSIRTIWPVPNYTGSTWLKNITDDLSAFDIGLMEAKDAGRNRSSWTLLAS